MGFVTTQHEAFRAKMEGRDQTDSSQVDTSLPDDQPSTEQPADQQQVPAPEGYEAQSQPQQ